MAMIDLKYIFYIGASPDEIWKVLTTPEGTKRVFYGSEIKSNFRVGSPVKWVGPGRAGNDTVHIFGTVLEFEPNRKFVHTSKVGEAYGSEHAKFESRVTYELEPIGKATKLTVIQDHWTDGDPSYENAASKGWWMLLSSIKTFVETGKPLEPTSVAHA